MVYAKKKMLFEVEPCCIDYCNMGSTVLHYNYIVTKIMKKILFFDVCQPPIVVLIILCCSVVLFYVCKFH